MAHVKYLIENQPQLINWAKLASSVWSNLKLVAKNEASMHSMYSRKLRRYRSAMKGVLHLCTNKVNVSNYCLLLKTHKNLKITKEVETGYGKVVPNLPFWPLREVLKYL